MGEVIVIVSGKGGVGKTTVAANIGLALSEKDKRVILVDADMGLRNLDIALGAENKIVYDLADVLDEVCDLETAVIGDEAHKNLFFIPSPQTRTSETVTTEKFTSLCRRLAEIYDYVLIDAPAGIGSGFARSICAADKAIVVTQPFMSAIRDADRTISLLEKENIKDISVLINSVNVDMIENGIMVNADFVLDVLGTKLLGIVPYDIKILENSAKGLLTASDKTAISSSAFLNIAERLTGNHVPIAEFTKEKKKKRCFFRFKK